MKKLLILLLALSIGVSLIACGDSGMSDGSDTTPRVSDTTDNTEPDDAPKTNTGYTVSLGNVTVTVGGDADALIASLGEPLDYMEAPSCIHEGYDRVYVFDGYSISTSPAADGTQYVSELALTTDAVVLDGALMIGSNVSDVEAKFGTDYTEDFGIRAYAVNGAIVSVMLDGDIVVGIAISAN